MKRIGALVFLLAASACHPAPVSPGPLVGGSLQDPSVAAAPEQSAPAPEDEEDAAYVEDRAVAAENRRLLAQLKAKGVDVRQSSRGVVINLPDVLFQFGRSDLTPAAASTVREIAEILRDAESRQLSIEGHTDSTGTIEANYLLSEARARRVAEELERDQIPRRRLSTKALGETDPISSNRTVEGQRKNRRVEIVILNPD